MKTFVNGNDQLEELASILIYCKGESKFKQKHMYPQNNNFEATCVNP